MSDETRNSAVGLSAAAVPAEIVYPESDGQPMANNTEQFDWIVDIKENLEAVFADNPEVFVAGDLFWYPRKGRADIVQAPDAMVVFGRPKGRRGSYKQWEEGEIGPQVVFEILSPSNRQTEMIEKFRFFERYGVEEYYLYDPDRNNADGWVRTGDTLEPIPELSGWVSPRLGVRFETGPRKLTLYRPDGSPFEKLSEVLRRAEAESRRADLEKQRADAAEAEIERLKKLLGQS